MLFIACGGDEPAPSGSGGRTGRTVDVIDNAYVPAERTVTVGTEVIWTHKGENAHTVTAADGSFDSHPDCPSGACMQQDDTFRHTFPTAGRFAYACKVHGELMSGTIVVE
jgi:plastocyanin